LRTANPAGLTGVSRRPILGPFSRGVVGFGNSGAETAVSTTDGSHVRFDISSPARSEPALPV
jgi:hypothetical protein